MRWNRERRGVYGSSPIDDGVAVASCELVLASPMVQDGSPWRVEPQILYAVGSVLIPITGTMLSTHVLGDIPLSVRY